MPGLFLSQLDDLDDWAGYWQGSRRVRSDRIRLLLALDLRHWYRVPPKNVSDRTGLVAPWDGSTEPHPIESYASMTRHLERMYTCCVTLLPLPTDLCAVVCLYASRLPAKLTKLPLRTICSMRSRAEPLRGSDDRKDKDLVGGGSGDCPSARPSRRLYISSLT
jgi:hypothetical protein